MYLKRLYLFTTTEITTVEMIITMTIAMVMMEVVTAMTMGLGVEPLACGGIVGGVLGDVLGVGVEPLGSGGITGGRRMEELGLSYI